MPTKRKLRRKSRNAREAAISEVNDIRVSLEGAYSSFNNLSDPLLLDACIYEINALRARYDHALRNAKARFIE